MAASSAGGARPSGRLGGGKRPFRVGTALGRIREAIRPLPKAAMFALAEEGHRTLFEQLVACRRLFAAAPTFHRAKASQIRKIALATDRLHGRDLPCDAEGLRSLCRQVGVEAHR